MLINMSKPLSNTEQVILGIEVTVLNILQIQEGNESFSTNRYFLLCFTFLWSQKIISRNWLTNRRKYYRNTVFFNTIKKLNS